MWPLQNLACSQPTVLSSQEHAARDADADHVAKILDAAIEAAPACVRERAIFPSIDWKRVAASKVAAMLTSLERSRVPCPGWLSKALLIGGHVLTAEAERHLVGHLRVLNRINTACRDGENGEDIAPFLAGLLEDAAIEPDIIKVLVGRLAELGRTQDGARLALAHTHRPHGLVRMPLEDIDLLADKMPAIRLRLAGASTTDMLAERLRPAFVAIGWRAEVSQSSYGQVIAELTGEQDNRDLLLVLLDFDGFVPIDWRNSPDQAAQLITDRVELLAAALSAFAERSSVPLLINTIPCASAPTAGLLDRRHATGLRRSIDQLNTRILEVAERSERIVVIDTDVALAALPLSQHIDPKLWFYGRVPYSLEATRALARAFAQAWRVLRQGPIKVLAVDLDNTLWGGVYGDDGLERLQCSQDFPGNAYLAMQQECLRLRHQGLLLVALSKNDAEAFTAFERHPEMAMRSGDFSAAAINWDPKPHNIRKIAVDLNLGLDSFLFIDDSPQERDAMRRQCPEVVVPEMPADPAERPLWLRRQARTWPVRLTAEDNARQALYATGKEVGKWKATAATHEDFLHGLEQRLTVGRLGKDTVARVAQMHQRTNQFNLTTVRSTESDISALTRKDWPGIALWGRVSDRFGDHGIVIAAVAAINGNEATIGSFLMSCRTVGREVERAFLGEVVRELAGRGVRRVRGEYIATPKNAMVRDFYALCGFEQVEEGDDRSSWSLDLDHAEPPGSQFVTIGWEA
jgi:FkbH-like protein